MTSKNTTLRSVNMAYIFGPSRHIARDEASRIHAAVCDRLGLDDITFAYQAEPAQGQAHGSFGMAFSRKDGQEVFQVALERQNSQAPMRLLLTNPWPRSLEDVQQRFDATAEAIFEVLGGNHHVILAETRLRAHCTAQGGNGLGYLRDQLLRFDPEWLASSGTPLTSAAISYSLGSQRPAEVPVREFRIEPLHADPTSLYLELSSRWTVARNMSDGTMPAALIHETPGEFLRASHEFLLEKANPRPGLAARKRDGRGSRKVELRSS